jgi:O-succinylbenzoic acid--CoA ligase
MTGYPFEFITINGRNIEISAILTRTAYPQDEFEQNTFDFICRWRSEEQRFELQTSGSTGAPKKISVSREQMVASATLTGEALSLMNGYQALICLDTRYIAGQMMLVRCFVIGMKIIAVTPCANPFVHTEQVIDFVALVPYQVYAILDSVQHKVFNVINTVIVGGAPIDAVAVKKLQSYSTQFYATYGMTETVSHVALKRLNGASASNDFKVLPGVEISLDDRGCLMLDVPYLSTRMVTNDIVEILGHGAFLWLGRFDHVINSGGVKIMPETVEEQVGMIFSELHYPHRFFISSDRDEKLGEKVVLYVEEKIFTAIEQVFLSETLRKVLPAYALPREIITVNKFETTQTGKINRLRTVQNSDKTLQKFTLKR